MKMKRCVIIGAAPNSTVAGMERITPEDYILCADGGLNYARQYGYEPNLVVGDFDSLEDRSLLANVEFRTLPVEKDDTDMIAAIRIAKTLGFSECLLLNGTGGRIDHTFANLTSLFFAEKLGIQACLIDGKAEIYACSSGRISLAGKRGYRLSLFAFGGKAGVNGKGMHYSLENRIFSPDFPLGVSNEIDTDDAWLEVCFGSILMILEKI